jgi:hypothetical protein
MPPASLVDAPSDPFLVYVGGVYADTSDIFVLGYQVSGGTSNASDGRQALVRRFNIAAGTERG